MTEPAAEAPGQPRIQSLGRADAILSAVMAHEGAITLASSTLLLQFDKKAGFAICAVTFSSSCSVINGHMSTVSNNMLSFCKNIDVCYLCIRDKF